jgi:hypothetical protein
MPVFDLRLETIFDDLYLTARTSGTFVNQELRSISQMMGSFPAAGSAKLSKIHISRRISPR